jgi:hypothetical protein
MTRLEMKDEFLLLYDRVASLEGTGYEDDEISMFLTKGQERVIYELYRPRGNKFLEGFENSEKRRKELDELVRNVELTSTSFSSNQSGTLENGTFIDLPSNFMWAIKEEITATMADCHGVNINKRIKVKPITHDEYTVNNNNPFKKPYSEMAWRLDYSRDYGLVGGIVQQSNKRHEIITDGSTIVTYHLRYISRPLPIIISQLPLTVGVYQSIDGYTGAMDCYLDSSLHRTIVDEAVKIATGTTKPEDYQIKQIESNQSE